MKMEIQPRIRMFAGPNGSGKSSLKSFILSILGPDLLGVYVNPDEIEKQIQLNGFLDLKEFKISSQPSDFLSHLQASILLKEHNFQNFGAISFDDQKIYFHGLEINSYLASAISDFIRNQLLQRFESFSFETVMSSQDKIHFMEKAKQLGYKTYLYFIATEDPKINISRVKERVSRGGHDVAEDKIISRYSRSLDLLLSAVKNTWRSYIFDNSSSKEILLAEISEGKIVEIKTDNIPSWFDKNFIQKITK